MGAAGVTCHGNGAEHCCYVAGRVCSFLEENTIPGRRWVCGFLRELGSWDRVHADSRYLEHVQPAWDEVGIVSCGAWGPGGGQCCFSEEAQEAQETQETEEAAAR